MHSCVHIANFPKPWVVVFFVTWLADCRFFISLCWKLNIIVDLFVCFSLSFFNIFQFAMKTMVAMSWWLTHSTVCVALTYHSHELQSLLFFLLPSPKNCIWKKFCFQTKLSFFSVGFSSTTTLLTQAAGTAFSVMKCKQAAKYQRYPAASKFVLPYLKCVQSVFFFCKLHFQVGSTSPAINLVLRVVYLCVYFDFWVFLFCFVFSDFYRRKYLVPEQRKWEI